MKRFLKHTLFFFLLAVVADLGIGVWGDYLQKHTKGGEALRLNDLLMKDEYDILFLGSSRAHHHYDTPFISDTLGLKAYNAGYDGNGVILAYAILQKTLERYSPKLVVLDVTPYVDMYSMGKEDYARYVANLRPYFRDPDIASILRDLSSAEWYKAHSGMVRYNTSIVPMTLYFLHWTGKDPYGFVYKTGVLSDESARGEKDGYEWDSTKYGYVRRIVHMAKEKSVPLIIAVSPEYNHYYSLGLDSLRTLCRENGILLLDHEADEDISNCMEFFDDPTHLNVSGARVYSRKIADEIKASALLN